jgi:hypothetical protein
MIKETSTTKRVGKVLKKSLGPDMRPERSVPVCGRIGAESPRGQITLDYVTREEYEGRKTAVKRHHLVFAIERLNNDCSCCSGYTLRWRGGDKLQARQLVFQAVRYPHDRNVMYLVDARGEVDSMGPIVLDDSSGSIAAFYDRGDALPAPKGKTAKEILQNGKFDGCLAASHLESVHSQRVMASAYESGASCACSLDPFQNTTGRTRPAPRKKK